MPGGEGRGAAWDGGPSAPPAADPGLSAGPSADLGQWQMLPLPYTLYPYTLPSGNFQYGGVQGAGQYAGQRGLDRGADGGSTGFKKQFDRLAPDRPFRYNQNRRYGRNDRNDRSRYDRSEYGSRYRRRSRSNDRRRRSYSSSDDGGTESSRSGRDDGRRNRSTSASSRSSESDSGRPSKRHPSEEKRAKNSSPPNPEKPEDSEKIEPDGVPKPSKIERSESDMSQSDRKKRRKYNRRSRYSRSYSRSRSRERSSKKYSRRRSSRSQSRSRSGRRGRRNNRPKYSDASDDSYDDVDGIALDESPPPSWRDRPARRYPKPYLGGFDNPDPYRPVALPPRVPPVAPFKNDGSFLEMFKKMQESQNQNREETVAEPQTTESKKPGLSFIGKRRGGRVLRTGMVKKAKTIEEQTVEDPPKDAWAIYMKEVKKYREAMCEEEVKTRPLVK